MPLPTMAIPWSRNGANALPIAIWAAGSRSRCSDNMTTGICASGLDDQEGHEHAVVEAALGILAHLQAGGRRSRPLDLGGDLVGRARGWVLKLIGVGREAVIVVKHARRGGDR